MSEEGKHANAGRSGLQRLVQAVSSQIARHSSSLLLFMVFCVVVAVGAFMIGDLHTATVQVQRMYAGSVQGLRQIGELQYEAQETRRSTLYALTTNDSNLQVEYADQSRGADRLVTDGIAQYLIGARMPREVEVGRRLQQDWAAYLRVRDEVLASILEGSTKEAVDLDLSGGVPRSLPRPGRTGGASGRAALCRLARGRRYARRTGSGDALPDRVSRGGRVLVAK